MTAIDWQIPPSVHHWLERLPHQAPVAVLLRHSVRGDLPPGEAGDSVPITEDGVRLARALGARLGSGLRSVHSSPLLRCVQTAEALCAGASVELPIHRERLLGAPGIYVVDAERAWSSWEAKGHEGVVGHLVGDDEPLPGMAAPDAAARFLVQHMLAAAGAEPGYHVFVTHDSLVTATAARILGQRFGKDAWPWYLEAAFFWREHGALVAAYRDVQRRRDAAPLCHLGERDVVELARREIVQTVGPDCRARFFLAGGAFKTLLTGRPPRDLDLWAPSGRDRELLVETLLARGARRLPENQFNEGFEIGGRIVEVPRKAEPETLAARLARFDIALSAIGVEHRPRDEWSAMIHPLARTSVARGEILLLEPLVNWKYALATLERMRRYAAELGYVVPAEQEAAVWQVFDSQPPEMQQGMLDRYERAAQGSHGVLEEATRRLTRRA